MKRSHALLVLAAVVAIACGKKTGDRKSEAKEASGPEPTAAPADVKPPADAAGVHCIVQSQAGTFEPDCSESLAECQDRIKELKSTGDKCAPLAEVINGAKEAHCWSALANPDSMQFISTACFATRATCEVDERRARDMEVLVSGCLQVEASNAEPSEPIMGAQGLDIGDLCEFYGLSKADGETSDLKEEAACRKRLDNISLEDRNKIATCANSCGDAMGVVDCFDGFGKPGFPACEPMGDEEQ